MFWGRFVGANISRSESKCGRACDRLQTPGWCYSESCSNNKLVWISRLGCFVWKVIASARVTDVAGSIYLGLALDTLNEEANVVVVGTDSTHNGMCFLADFHILFFSCSHCWPVATCASIGNSHCRHSQCYCLQCH